jgi:sporulation protein YlmC with PRC-barrel domain
MRIRNIASSAVVFGLTAALMGGTALSQTTSTEDPILEQDQTGTQAQDQMGTQTESDTMTPGTGVAGDDHLTPDTGMASDDGMPRRSVADSAEPYTGDVLAGITADELIGMNVVDASGDSVGSVTDLLFGADDQVDQAIIDVGGFLGFGAKSVAIPLDDLTIAEGDGEVVLNKTRDELDAMSEWTRGDDGWMSN